MISTLPLEVATPYQTIADRVSAFLQAAKSATEGGISWVEFGELSVALLRMSIATLDQITTLSGAEKKAIALEAVAALFDSIADRCVPASLYPLWLISRPAIRSLVLALASGAVESLLPLVRSAK